MLHQNSLTAALIRRGAMAPDEAARLHERTQGSAQQLRKILLEEGLLSESGLAEVLAEQHGLPYRTLDHYRVDFDAFPSIPVEWMRQHCFVPLESREEVLTIAVPDPSDLKTLDLLDRLLDRELRITVAPRQAILDSLKES